MTAVSTSIEECKAARAAATGKVRAFGRTVRRFAKAGARDDGTPRCIACGQIDEAPWHKPWLCFGMISQAPTPARAEALDEGAAREVKPRAIADAPRDGTMLRLWVRYPEDGSWTPLEDAHESWTIGFNNFANTEDDRWQVVGWSWSHDLIVEASNDVEVLGWLPFHGEQAHPSPPSAADKDRVRIAVEKLESIRMMRSDRASGPYPRTYKGGFDAASDLMSGWASEALTALQSTAQGAADHG